MTASTPAHRVRPRITPCVVVLVTTGIALLVASLAAYGVHVNDRRFLPEFRAPADYEACIAVPINYAINSSENNEAIFLGDSTAVSSIKPVDFEQQTGLRAYNIASLGVIGVDGCALTLRTYLAHHPKPKLLVFSVCPWSLSVEPEVMAPVDARRRFFYCYGSPTVDEVQGTVTPLTGRILWGIRRGGGIILGRLGGNPQRFLDAPIPGRRGLTYNILNRDTCAQRGYYGNPGALPAGWRRPSDPSDSNAAPVGRVLPDFKAAFSELAELARKEGIPLLVRLTPVSPPPSDEDYEPIRSWLASVESKGVCVSRPEVLIYDAPLFSERLHCNDNGARLFTALVAHEATRALGGH